MIRITTILQKGLILALLIFMLAFPTNSVEASQGLESKGFVESSSIENSSQIRFRSLTEKEILLTQKSRQNWNPPTGNKPSQSLWGWLIGKLRRGRCSNLESPLTAVLPITSQYQQGFKDAFGLTVSDHPTFWIYIPKLPSEIKMAELVIQDKDGNDFLINPISVDLFGKTSPNQSFTDLRQSVRIILSENTKIEANHQIIGISLPPEVKSLSSGEFYHWYFSIICDSRRPSRNPSVDGWIKVIQPEPNFEKQMENDLDRSQMYARDGIWYDAFTALAMLRCREPKNDTFASLWSSLLRDQNVNLNEVADKSKFIARCAFS